MYKMKNFDTSMLTRFCTFGLSLASLFHDGTSFQLVEQVSTELPMSECDLVIVSSTPMQGEMHLCDAQNILLIS